MYGVYAQRSQVPPSASPVETLSIDRAEERFFLCLRSWLGGTNGQNPLEKFHI